MPAADEQLEQEADGGQQSENKEDGGWHLDDDDPRQDNKQGGEEEGDGWVDDNVDGEGQQEEGQGEVSGEDEEEEGDESEDDDETGDPFHRDGSPPRNPVGGGDRLSDEDDRQPSILELLSADQADLMAQVREEQREQEEEQEARQRKQKRKKVTAGTATGTRKADRAAAERLSLQEDAQECEDGVSLAAQLAGLDSSSLSSSQVTNASGENFIRNTQEKSTPKQTHTHTHTRTQRPPPSHEVTTSEEVRLWSTACH